MQAAEVVKKLVAALRGCSDELEKVPANAIKGMKQSEVSRQLRRADIAIEAAEAWTKENGHGA